MDLLLAERVYNSEKDPVDYLKLLWGERKSIREANLVFDIFGLPETISHSPQGLTIWKEIHFLDKILEISVKDRSDDIVTISWEKHDSERIDVVMSMLSPNMAILGKFYMSVGEEFRDALSIFSMVIDVSNGKSFFMALKTSQKIQSLGGELLKKLFITPKKDVIPPVQNYVELPRIKNNTTSSTMMEQPHRSHPVYIRDVGGSIPTITRYSTDIPHERRSGSMEMRSPTGNPVPVEDVHRYLSIKHW
jgi:hypothetical protein